MTRPTTRNEDRAPLNPGYAIPPPLFPPTPRSPAHWPLPPAVLVAPAPEAVPRRRHRARKVDGAFMSGALTVLSLASLLVTIAVVAV
ncbi:hypothetical protein [Streptomyces sp. AM6-12]|uniref:hypothetical protein n=1 Tax=Streptomyces sp. AM6-12 TaxID=3345149 RepID=UPI00379854DE